LIGRAAPLGFSRRENPRSVKIFALGNSLDSQRTVPAQIFNVLRFPNQATRLKPTLKF